MNKSQRNLYLKRRILLIEKHKINRILHKEYLRSIGYFKDKFDHRYKNFYHIKSPSVCSIKNNPSETLIFFNDILHRSTDGFNVFIDFSDIVSITIDSLLYLISIKHRLEIFGKKNRIIGKMPTDNTCKSFFMKTGFLDYWKTDSSLIYSSDCVRIKHHKMFKSDVIRDICIFVHSKLGVDRLYTKPLYDVINELMSNTVGHAYPSEQSKIRDWYLYTEYDPKENVVNFAFLDIGEGIPRTIQKKISEHILKLATFGTKGHGNLILQALHGFKRDGIIRSSTNKPYRGKGLPRIFKIYKKQKITNLYIRSGRGEFNEMKIADHNKSLSGTFVSWSFGRGG